MDVMKRSQTSKDLAARVRGWCESYPHPLLPSLPELARLLGRRKRDIALACARLRKEGFLDYGRGRRMRQTRLLRFDGTGAKSPEPAADLLYRKMAEDIRGGLLKTGTALPKAAYLMAQYHVGDRTVRKTYARLEAEGLASRAGRRLLVGPGLRPAPGSGSGPSVRKSPGALIILARNAARWVHLCRDTPTQGFGLSFLGEARRCGIRLFIGLFEAPRGRDPVSGMAHFDDVADWLGETHLGTLVIDKRAELPDLPNWMIKASAKGSRRVAWFDKAEEGPAVPLKGGSVGPWQARCHFHEAGAAAAALEHLALHGHRALLYPYRGTIPWQKARRDSLFQEGLRRGLRVEGFDLDPYDFKSPEARTHNTELFRRLETETQGRDREVARLLGKRTGEIWKSLPPDIRRHQPRNPQGFAGVLRAMNAVENRVPRLSPTDPSLIPLGKALAMTALAPLFLDPALTAVVSPNDFFMRHHLLSWLRKLDIAVPGRVSALSFDNESRESFTPWNTVDFGFEELGYLAFHFLLGDVPVRRSPGGDIPGRCLVVDQGSVGPPRLQGAEDGGRAAKKGSRTG